jgi:hypothetical protein
VRREELLETYEAGSLLGNCASPRGWHGLPVGASDVPALFYGQLGSTGFSGCRQHAGHVSLRSAIIRLDELNDLPVHCIRAQGAPVNRFAYNWPSRSSRAGVLGGSALRLRLRRERTNFLGQLEDLPGQIQ